MKQGERVQVKETTTKPEYVGMTGVLKKRVVAPRSRGSSGYYVLLDNGETVKFFKNDLTTTREIHHQKLAQLRRSLTDHDLEAMRKWCGWVMDDRIHSVSENTASIVLNLIEAFEITVKENSL